MARMRRIVLEASRARVYQTLRSAHLERAHEFAPAAILYTSRRYDFEDRLARGLELVRASPWRIAAILARSEVRELEVNEPLMLGAVRGAALAVAAVRVRGRLTGRRTLVVAYAIGNDDPRRAEPGRSVRRRLGRRLDFALAAAVWRRLDRVAFGSDAARRVYDTALAGRRAPDSLVIPALPAPCPCTARMPEHERPRRAVFLGAFVERKGFPLVLAAWEAVRSELADAELVLVGKGRLVDAARHAAAADPRIRLLVDPERDEIHRILADADVLVLPSQQAPQWREQIGLPIVEGLAHGCTVVTTSQTGLAGWLAAHGHRVVDAPTEVSALARELAQALEHPTPRSAVLASLPGVDGRLAADSWLFTGAVPEGAVPTGNRAEPEAGRHVAAR